MRSFVCSCCLAQSDFCQHITLHMISSLVAFLSSLSSHHLPLVTCLSPPWVVIISMKSWMNTTEFAWLAEKSPGWHQVRSMGRVVGWLTTTTGAFRLTFPDWESILYLEVYEVSRSSPSASHGLADSWYTESQVVVLPPRYTHRSCDPQACPYQSSSKVAT